MNFLQTDWTGCTQSIKKFLFHIFLALSFFGCSERIPDSLKSVGGPEEEISIENNPQIEQAQNSVWQIHNISAIVEELYVRNILLSEEEGLLPMKGTAFAIDSNRFVTNFHNFYYILKQDPSAAVILQQEKENNSFQLTVNRIHAASAAYDLVIFETEMNVQYHLNLEENPPQSDEELIALGYPEWEFRKMKKMGKIFNKEPYYIFPVNHFFLAGASGSPVLNFRGQVVGILSAASGNISIAVKSQKLKDLIEGNVGINCSDETDLETCMKKELKNLKNSADRGDAQAQYQLGSFYASESKKMESDWKLTFKWKEKAAKQGHTLAQFEAGQMYLSGQGVKLNPKVAFQRTKESAEQGFIMAQFELGQMYSDKELLELAGVEPNPKTASEWIQKSAKQGYALAQNKMGLSYIELLNFSLPDHLKEISFQSAAGWFKKAADQGFPESQYNLAQTYFSKKNATEKELQFAFELIQKAAEQDYSPAQYQLVEMYNDHNYDYNGDHHDYKKMLKILKILKIPEINPKHKRSMHFHWLSKSAKQGHADAQYQLAIQYINKKRKTDTDEELAFYWMQKAANQDHVLAQYDLGKMYFEKKDKTEEDILWGFHWLEQAAYREYDAAKYILGHQYKKYGHTDMGIYWIEEAAKQEHIFALYDFGRILEDQGNLKDAKSLIETAAKRGLGIAQKHANEKYKKATQH